MRHERYWRRYEGWPRPVEGQRFRLLTHRVAGGGKGAWGTVVRQSPDPVTGRKVRPPREYQVTFDGCPRRVYRLGHYEMALQPYGN